eukprot:ctg_7436.g539
MVGFVAQGALSRCLSLSTNCGYSDSVEERPGCDRRARPPVLVHCFRG